MPRASLFESAHAARRLWVPTAVVQDQVVRVEPGAATAWPCAEGTSVGTGAPSTKVIFAGGRGQIHGARRVSSYLRVCRHYALEHANVTVMSQDS